MDSAQQALEEQQTEMLRQQQQIITQTAQQQKIIEPFLFQSMGLTPTYDNSGSLVGLTQNPQTAQIQDLQQKVTIGQLQQEQAALNGTLPVNPLVFQQLNQQDQQMRNTMSANLGPGWESSTPGQQAMNQEAITRAGVIQAANTGQMSLDQQLAASGTGTYGATLGQVMQGVTGINSLGFNTAGAFGQAAYGYGQAQQAYEANAANRYQYSALGVQAQESNNAAIGSGVGALAGIAGAAIIF
jgi:hypothetical protein